MDKARSLSSADSAISARPPLSFIRAENAENAEGAEVVQLPSLRGFAASREINTHVPRALTQGCWTHAKPRRREDAKKGRWISLAQRNSSPKWGRGTACGGGARATASVVPTPLPLVAAPPSASPPPPRRGEELV
jgi:hypothetical protein